MAEDHLPEPEHAPVSAVEVLYWLVPMLQLRLVPSPVQRLTYAGLNPRRMEPPLMIPRQEDAA
jgi:hypothetical protein